MPAYTAPGVYVEEIPSGVRTIVGVATSITAFVGVAPRGTIEPTRIATFGDYARNFGSLDMAYPMSYAVRQFFDNGGGDAIVVRITKGAKASRVEADVLLLDVASPGTWGDNVQVVVSAASDPSDASNPNLFSLLVQELDENQQPVTSENFFNVSIDPAAPRFVGLVLEQGSSLVRLGRDSSGNWEIPEAVPAAGTYQGAGGGDEDPTDPIDSDDLKGEEDKKTGFYALGSIDIFNLLVIPPLPGGTPPSNDVYQSAAAFCQTQRALLLVDAPDSSPDQVPDPASIVAWPNSRNAAIYYPHVSMTAGAGTASFPPSGAIAGIMARTDSYRGVWKAPAGTEAAIAGAVKLSRVMTEAESRLLNPKGVNCLRAFPIFGHVVWGARTMAGADQLADDYKYVPIRRLALYIEESLYRGTQWVVFEPNDEPLWAQIRLNVGAFMHGLFRQGAFQGKSKDDAYFVKCDSETTPQADINLGIVNIVVGFAPLKPAEFVVIKIQQIAGQIEV